MSRIVKNYMFNMSYQILVILLPIITIPYISRVLKPNEIGAYNYAYSIVSFIVMCAQLGTTLYGQREVAFVQGDQERRSILFKEIFLIRLLATLFVVPLYGYIIMLNQNFSSILMRMFIYIIANIFDISWFYQGLEEFKRTAIRNIAVKVSGALLIFALVHGKNDLLIYVCILASAQLFGNFSLWIGLKRKIIHVHIKKVNIKKHFKPIVVLFLPTAAMYIYLYVDKIILGLLSNNIQVGYYSQSEKIVRLLLTIITSLGAVLLPHISNLINQNKIKLVSEEVKKSISYVMRVGLPMVIGSIIIAPRFIPFFLGEDYQECISLFSVLSILIIIVGLASVVGQAVLIPMKKQLIYSISIIVGAILNIVVDFALIPSLGAMGASIGTIIAESTVTTIQLYFVNKILGINIVKVLLKSYKCYISAFAMALIGYLLSRILSFNFINLILIIGCCVFVYFILLFILNDNELRYLIEKIKAYSKSECAN